MKSLSWVPYAAARYVSARRRDKSSPSSLLSVLGIAVGVMALVVVLAVMNGFQMGFMESILEISSYHLRMEGAQAEDGEGASLLEGLRALPQVASAVPFLEVQTIARGGRRSQAPALVRGLPPDAALRDGGMAAKLVFEAGSFDLEAPRSVLLGAELARVLGVSAGGSVHLLALSGTGFADAAAEDATFTVTGVFRSGFYEYDAGWAFVGLGDAEALHGPGAPVAYGIKLRDRWADREASAAVARLAPDARVSSWRDFNRAFFGALRTEKIMMFILVALIFVVVALNVFQAQRRVVLERRDEIGLLRAVGAPAYAVRLVFACDGFIVGLAGAVAGIVPGLAIAVNVRAFFDGLESVANLLIGALDAVVRLATGGTAGGLEPFSVFSPAVFYLKEIPSRVIPAEAALVFLFGLGSATLAAWLASGKASKIDPAEVLRDE